MSAKDSHLKKKLMNALKSRLEWVVGASVQSALDSEAVNLTKIRQRRAADQSVEFIEKHMPNVQCFGHRLDLLRFSVESSTVDGLYCEFGVYKAESLNFIASLTRTTVHGFDSFEGLPEFWKDDRDKGAFRLEELPMVRPNVRLHKGWFADSLPSFLSENRGPVSLLHLDADLYSSTKTVFDALGLRIVPGTIIVFDEFFNYPGWQVGEYKAWQEFVNFAGVQFDYLGYTPFRQVAVKVIRTSTVLKVT
jgi:hypothetical protein